MFFARITRIFLCVTVALSLVVDEDGVTASPGNA